MAFSLSKETKTKNNFPFKKSILIIAIAFSYFPSILYAHGGESHKSVVSSENEILQKKISVNGSELIFLITSHDISLTIIDKKNGKQVKNAIVKLKIISPDKSVEIQKLERKKNHYKSSFSMKQKGTYKALALIKIGNKKKKAGFQYSIE